MNDVYKKLCNAMNDLADCISDILKNDDDLATYVKAMKRLRCAGVTNEYEAIVQLEKEIDMYRKKIFQMEKCARGIKND